MVAPHKRYETWPAANQFYCHGRIMGGPSLNLMICALFMMCVTAALFLAFTCPYLISNMPGGIAMVVIFCYLFVLCVVSLLRTSFSDPGIIPRDTNWKESPEEIEERKKDEEIDKEAPFYYKPKKDKTKQVVVEGVEIKLKWCETCKIYRPPRASHCSTCDNCYHEFDHHCVWVGNCVAKHNYRYFITFVNTVAGLVVWIFVFSFVKLIMTYYDHGHSGWESFKRAVEDGPVCLALIIFCFLAVWSVGGLSCFHLYLTRLNVTTYEELKHSYGAEGLFNRGLLKNIARVYFAPAYVGFVNFREVLENEENEENEVAQTV